MKQNTPNVAVIGGGIAGLSTAIALRKLGLHPQIFEAAPEIKALGAGITLAPNAIIGFERLGIADKVVAAGRVLPAFSILDHEGRPILMTDNGPTGQTLAIHRADLHRILLDELPETDVFTNKKATHVTQDGEGVTVFFQDGAQHHTQYVLVADGIHSAIRQQLAPESELRYAGYTCWRAVVENPGLVLDGAAETWAPEGRFGIIPMSNNQIYWFLCINAPEQDPAMKALRVADLAEIFSHYHAPIPQLLRATRDDQLILNDTFDLKPLSRYAYGRVLLLGDAAHATTPNLGQGACQAIEDAAVLLQEWEYNGSDPAQVFERVECRRLSRTHMIVRRSRDLGWVAQWSNPWAIGLRNAALRLFPTSANERQLAAMYQTDF